MICMIYCLTIVDVSADDKGLPMLSSLIYSNGLASAVLKFLYVATVRCRSKAMSYCDTCSMMRKMNELMLIILNDRADCIV